MRRSGRSPPLVSTQVVWWSASAATWTSSSTGPTVRHWSSRTRSSRCRTETSSRSTWRCRRSGRTRRHWCCSLLVRRTSTWGSGAISVTPSSPPGFLTCFPRTRPTRSRRCAATPRSFPTFRSWCRRLRCSRMMSRCGCRGACWAQSRVRRWGGPEGSGSAGGAPAQRPVAHSRPSRQG